MENSAPDATQPQLAAANRPFASYAAAGAHTRSAVRLPATFRPQGVAGAVPPANVGERSSPIVAPA